MLKHVIFINLALCSLFSIFYLVKVFQKNTTPQALKAPILANMIISTFLLCLSFISNIGIGLSIIVLIPFHFLIFILSIIEIARIDKVLKNSPKDPIISKYMVTAVIPIIILIIALVYDVAIDIY